MIVSCEIKANSLLERCARKFAAVKMGLANNGEKLPSELWQQAVPWVELVLQESGHGELVEALEIIERWFGEFPQIVEKWPDGSPMSYVAYFGSNGERDFMRGVARAALRKVGMQ
jgi:hypothetical protein